MFLEIFILSEDIRNSVDKERFLFEWLVSVVIGKGKME